MNDMQTNRNKWLTLLAAPAVAGLIGFGVVGCDDNEAEDVGGGITTPEVEPGADPALEDPGLEPETDPALDPAAEPAAGRIGEPAADQANPAQEQLSQSLENLQERLEAMKDQVEANVDIEGFGTGSPVSEQLGQMNEIADAIQASVNDGDWAQARVELNKLKAMQMPADLQGMVTGLEGMINTASGASGASGAMNDAMNDPAGAAGDALDNATGGSEEFGGGNN